MTESALDTPFEKKALVLFSGGQDSATCLAWALKHFEHVETVGYAYGQRHSIELECRDILRDKIGKLFAQYGRVGEDHTIDLASLGALSETSLTRETEIIMSENGLPSTFVPGRNLIFLTYAAALAYRRGIKHIITGVCETDYSGYPDCRDDTIKALQVALNLGMEQRFVLHTPLMWLDKAQTWQMCDQLAGSDLVEVIRKESHSCYKGDRTHEHVWGYGCGDCPACQLRAEGWRRYQEAL
ncbi:7-cyano-7-deazaguanine synthase QueC [Aristophania vespae]|uniref:7-cyano-7-deazaguanine synthase n=1 Tax=Aristophania vespae TaxID=2697033 RepID=A0A6P1NBR2_9PROT|nr:7-cyano-7-deazaguanine synthase QueC [Aristophania vespae]QHI96115.1 7-cyano-7-deazaguanine synthase QueC [Aristophania vespae]UMM63888.1 7-cyano-7-deazaguanine synthase [Aristophania vespae]